MVDTKITDVTSGTVAGADELIINDVTDDSDKKVTAQSIADLAGGGFSTVYKTADEPITTDTTFTDDTDLQFPVDASSNYAILVFHVFNDNGGAGDYKYSYSFPAGMTGTRANSYWNSAVTEATTGNWDAIANVGVTGKAMLMNVGYIKTGVTAGTFAFQWAQFSSSATATTLYEGSFIMYKKLN